RRILGRHKDSHYNWMRHADNSAQWVRVALPCAVLFNAEFFCFFLRDEIAATACTCPSAGGSSISVLCCALLFLRVFLRLASGTEGHAGQKSESCPVSHIFLRGLHPTSLACLRESSSAHFRGRCTNPPAKARKLVPELRKAPTGLPRPACSTLPITCANLGRFSFGPVANSA